MQQDNNWILYHPITTGTLLRNLRRQQAAYEKECRFLSQIIFVSRLRPELATSLIDFFNSPDSHLALINQYKINLN